MTRKGSLPRVLGVSLVDFPEERPASAETTLESRPLTAQNYVTGIYHQANSQAGNHMHQTTNKGTTMTILCPKEFAEAARFALEADDALEAEIYRTGDAARRKGLEMKRGQAAKTLLSCFASRAYSDNIDNENPFFPDGSDVRCQNGNVRNISKMYKYDWPIRETVIVQDIAPHSFFFRERWIDPHSREQVDVFDRCWYIFKDGTTQDAANEMTDEELEEALNKSTDGSVTRTFCPEVLGKAVADKLTCVGTMRRRESMCGGIIYHADYGLDGKPSPYGSWSTHT